MRRKWGARGKTRKAAAPKEVPNGLILAASSGDETALLEALRTPGLHTGSLQHKDSNGLDALMWSCKKGLPNAVEALLNYGVSPLHTDHNGFHSLTHAVRANSIPCIEVLLRAAKGNAQFANITNITDERSRTAMSYAVREGYLPIVTLLLQDPAIDVWCVVQPFLSHSRSHSVYQNLTQKLKKLEALQASDIPEPEAQTTDDDDDCDSLTSNLSPIYSEVRKVDNNEGTLSNEATLLAAKALVRSKLASQRKIVKTIVDYAHLRGQVHCTLSSSKSRALWSNAMRDVTVSTLLKEARDTFSVSVLSQALSHAQHSREPIQFSPLDIERLLSLLFLMASRFEEDESRKLRPCMGMLESLVVPCTFPRSVSSPGKRPIHTTRSTKHPTLPFFEDIVIAEEDEQGERVTVEQRQRDLRARNYLAYLWRAVKGCVEFWGSVKKGGGEEAISLLIDEFEEMVPIMDKLFRFGALCEQAVEHPDGIVSKLRTLPEDIEFLKKHLKFSTLPDFLQKINKDGRRLLYWTSGLSIKLLRLHVSLMSLFKNLPADVTQPAGKDAIKRLELRHHTAVAGLPQLSKAQIESTAYHLLEIAECTIVRTLHGIDDADLSQSKLKLVTCTAIFLLFHTGRETVRASPLFQNKLRELNSSWQTLLQSTPYLLGTESASHGALFAPCCLFAQVSMLFDARVSNATVQRLFSEANRAVDVAVERSEEKNDETIDEKLHRIAKTVPLAEVFQTTIKEPKSDQNSLQLPTFLDLSAVQHRVPHRYSFMTQVPANPLAPIDPTIREMNASTPYDTSHQSCSVHFGTSLFANNTQNKQNGRGRGRGACSPTGRGRGRGGRGGGGGNSPRANGSPRRDAANFRLEQQNIRFLKGWNVIHGEHDFLGIRGRNWYHWMLQHDFGKTTKKESKGEKEKENNPIYVSMEDGPGLGFQDIPVGEMMSCVVGVVQVLVSLPIHPEFLEYMTAMKSELDLGLAATQLGVDVFAKHPQLVTTLRDSRKKQFIRDSLQHSSRYQVNHLRHTLRGVPPFQNNIAMHSPNADSANISDSKKFGAEEATPVLLWVREQLFLRDKSALLDYEFSGLPVIQKGVEMREWEGIGQWRFENLEEWGDCATKWLGFRRVEDDELTDSTQDYESDITSESESGSETHPPPYPTRSPENPPLSLSDAPPQITPPDSPDNAKPGEEEEEEDLDDDWVTESSGGGGDDLRTEHNAPPLCGSSGVNPAMRCYAESNASGRHLDWPSGDSSDDDDSRFIQVDRSNVFPSTIDNLLSKPYDRPIEVKFLKEPGRGVGPNKEFFSYVSPGLYHNEALSLFSATATGVNRSLLMFNRSVLADNNIDREVVTSSQPTSCTSMEDLRSREGLLKLYCLTGKLTGFSCINELELGGGDLAPGFYKLLLSHQLSVADTKFIDVNVHNSLRAVEQIDNENDLAALDLVFTFSSSYDINHEGKKRTEHKEVELVKGGSTMKVTKRNRRRYINLMVAAVHVAGVEPFLQAFCSGFWAECPVSMSRFLLTSDELHKGFCGEIAIDCEQWEQNTTYDPPSAAGSEVVRWFWRYVKEQSQETLRLLLAFTTGADTLPSGGFAKLADPFSIDVGARADEEMRLVFTTAGKEAAPLPAAHTCYNNLVCVVSIFLVAQQKQR